MKACRLSCKRLLFKSVLLLLLLLLLQEELPESFYKLPRIRFLLILCKEILRINKWVTDSVGVVRGQP